MKFSINYCIPLLTFSLYSAQYQDKMLLPKLHIEVQSNDNWIYELNTRGALSQPENRANIVSSAAIPLFSAYPKLKEALPYIALGSLPTPVQKLEKLSTALGVSGLYIKKDDLTGAFRPPSVSQTFSLASNAMLVPPAMVVARVRFAKAEPAPMARAQRQRRGQQRRSQPGVGRHSSSNHRTALVDNSSAPLPRVSAE